MATSSHVITEATVIGTERVILGQFVNETDGDGDVPTSLSRVNTWHPASAGVADTACAFYRNSTTTTEWTKSTGTPHLGGGVHYTGLDFSIPPTYRYVAWGK